MLDWKRFKGKKLGSLEKAIKEGEADEEILNLLSTINEIPECVTTSSCAGRIVFLAVEKDKVDAYFWRKWHSPPSYDEFIEGLKSYSDRKPLWIKFDPFIIHVACKTIFDALVLMKAVKNAGIKRGGIQGFKGKAIIEIEGHQRFASPVKFLREDKLKEMYELLIKMMKENEKQRERLREEIERIAEDWEKEREKYVRRIEEHFLHLVKEE